MSLRPAAFQTLPAALTTTVRIAGKALPLWSVLAPLLVVYPIALAVGAVALSSHASRAGVAEPSAPRPASTAQVPANAAPASADSADAPPSISAEAVNGEARTSSAILKLAAARLERERDSAKTLRKKIEQDPLLLGDKAVIRDLRRFTLKEETAYEGLAAMAAAPGPMGADLLYEIWTGTPQRNDVTALAQTLVYSSDVRPKASPALAVALDLRAASTCEEVRTVLPTAVSDGDRRSLHLLIKLRRKWGCGPNQRQDCYGCLRSGAPLDEAINAAKNRPAPF